MPSALPIPIRSTPRPRPRPRPQTPPPQATQFSPSPSRIPRPRRPFPPPPTQLNPAPSPPTTPTSPSLLTPPLPNFAFTSPIIATSDSPPSAYQGIPQFASTPVRRAKSDTYKSKPLPSPSHAVRVQPPPATPPSRLKGQALDIDRGEADTLISSDRLTVERVTRTPTRTPTPTPIRQTARTSLPPPPAQSLLSPIHTYPVSLSAPSSPQTIKKADTSSESKKKLKIRVSSTSLTSESAPPPLHINTNPDLNTPTPTSPSISIPSFASLFGTSESTLELVGTPTSAASVQASGRLMKSATCSWLPLHEAEEGEGEREATKGGKGARRFTAGDVGNSINNTLTPGPSTTPTTPKSNSNPSPSSKSGIRVSGVKRFSINALNALGNPLKMRRGTQHRGWLGGWSGNSPARSKTKLGRRDGGVEVEFGERQDRELDGMREWDWSNHRKNRTPRWPPLPLPPPSHTTHTHRHPDDSFGSIGGMSEDFTSLRDPFAPPPPPNANASTMNLKVKSRRTTPYDGEGYAFRDSVDIARAGREKSNHDALQQKDPPIPSIPSSFTTEFQQERPSNPSQGDIDVDAETPAVGASGEYHAKNLGVGDAGGNGGQGLSLRIWGWGEIPIPTVGSGVGGGVGGSINKEITAIPSTETGGRRLGVGGGARRKPRIANQNQNQLVLKRGFGYGGVCAEAPVDVRERTQSSREVGVQVHLPATSISNTNTQDGGGGGGDEVIGGRMSVEGDASVREDAALAEMLWRRLTRDCQCDERQW